MSRKRDESSKDDNKSSSSSRSDKSSNSSKSDNVSSNTSSSSSRVERTPERSGSETDSRFKNSVLDNAAWRMSSGSSPSSSRDNSTEGKATGSGTGRSLGGKEPPVPATMSDDLRLSRFVNSFDPGAPYPATMSGDMRLMRAANSSRPDYDRLAGRDGNDAGTLTSGVVEDLLATVRPPTIEDLVTGAHGSLTATPSGTMSLNDQLAGLLGMDAPTPTPAAQQGGIDWAGIFGAKEPTPAAQQSGIDWAGIGDALGFKEPTAAAKESGIDWEGISRMFGFAPSVAEPGLTPTVRQAENFETLTPPKEVMDVLEELGFVGGPAPGKRNRANAIPDRLTADPDFSYVDATKIPGGGHVLTGEVDPVSGLPVTEPIQVAEPAAVPSGPMAPIPLAYSGIRPSAPTYDELYDVPVAALNGSGGPVSTGGSTKDNVGAQPTVWDNVVSGAGEVLGHTTLGSIVKKLFPEFWEDSGRTMKGLDNGGGLFDLFNRRGQPTGGSSIDRGTEGGMGSGRAQQFEPYWASLDYEHDSGDSRNTSIIDHNGNGVPDYLEITQIGQPVVTGGGTTPVVVPSATDRDVFFPEIPPYAPGRDDEWLYFRPKKKLAEGGMVTADGQDPRIAIFQEAEKALKGQSPDPETALRTFVDTFGEEALADLQKKVASEQPRMVEGPGGPTDDMVPAMIEGQEPAALSDGEFVMTADAVMGAGDGDAERGAEQLMRLNDMLAAQR